MRQQPVAGAVALGLSGVVPAATAAKRETIRWAYPERNKWPLIADAPNSAGFFDALFTQTAALAGFDIAVERLPKARAWQHLERGSVDFYPGASFSAERAKTVLWLDTGLRSREVCLLRPGLRLRGPLAQNPGLLLGVEPGSSKIEQFPQLRTQHFGARLTVDKAIDILLRERADVVVVDIEPLTAYVARSGETSLDKLGIGVDSDCIGAWTPMFLAWSRAALGPQATAWPAPGRAQDQSALLPPASKAARFHRALMRLKAQGVMARLAVQHGIPPPPG